MLTHAFSENGESEILIWEPVTASIRSDQHRDGHKRGPKPQEEIRLDSFLFRPSYQSCHPTSHMTEKGGAKFLQTSLAPTLALHWQLTTFVRGATETWMCEVWGYSAYMGMACDKVWLLSQLEAVRDTVQLYNFRHFYVHMSCPLFQYWLSKS